MEHISKIAEKINLEENIELYGKYKAKINFNEIEEKEKKAKLILVTAMTPTKMGEGKTTMSIGIADGLSYIGKKTIVALREPSLRTSFWTKRRSYRRRKF